MKELIAVAEGFGKSKSKKIGDFEWINKKQQLHEMEFSVEMSVRSPSPSPLATPTKKTHFDFDDSAMVRCFHNK